MHLFLRLSIKNLSIDGACVALLKLFGISDNITVGPFGGLLSADYPDIKKIALFL